MDLWFYERNTDNCKLAIQIEEAIYSETSPFQKIDFYKSKDFGIFFTLDDMLMVTEKDEFIYHDMIVHVPMAVNPSIKKVLVIGGGDGGTVRELTRYDSIDLIHMVEIDERVVRLCENYLPLTSYKLSDKRVSLLFEDGVKFVRDKKDFYDLIIVDSTDPIGPGEGLFTSEFYRDAYEALKSNGILINQHESPYFEEYREEMLKAHKKIKKIFETSEVYQFHMPTYSSGHWLFGFASKGLHPVKDHKKEEWEDFKLDTKYYNSDIHVGSFMLPTYVRDLLASV